MFDDGLDRERMARIARADARAFEELYSDYAPPIAAFVQRMLHDAGLVEDVLQETFWKLWRAAPRWRGEAKVSTYLFQIARNAALDALDKKKRTRDRECGSENTEDVPDLGSSGTPNPENAELRLQVRRAIEGLPEEQRVVIWLAQVDGLACREVSEILNLPLGTVKSRLASAAEALRFRLRETWAEQKR
jgi:RNA polymerase sigma-70 factor (ECF subfamily)